MAPNQQRIRTLYEISVDRKKAKEATGTLDQIQRELKKLDREKSLGRLADQAAQLSVKTGQTKQGVEALSRRLKELGASEKEVARVTQEFRRLEEAGRKAQQTTTLGGGIRRFFGAEGSELATLGREARLAAPAIPIPGTNISSEGAFRLAEVTGKLGGNFGKLATIGGALGFAIIGISTQMENFQRVIEGATKVLNAVAQARIDQAEFLATATRREIQQRREELEVRRLALQAAAEQAARDKALLDQQLAQGGPGGQFLRGLDKLGGGGPLADARARADDAKAALEALNTELNGLDDVAGTTAGAFGDLQEAQRRAQESLIRRAATIRGNLNEDNLEDFDKRLEALGRERDFLREFVATLDPASDSAFQLNRELVELSGQINVLALDVRPLVEELDAARRAEEARKKAIEDAKKAAEEQARLEERRRKAIQSLADFAANFGRRIQQIQTRANQTIEDAGRKLGIDQSEARRKAELDITEAIRKAGLKRVEIIEKAEKDIQKILRRSRLAELEAIQERDAVALFAARARRDQELAEANERRDDALEAQKKSAAEEIRRIRLNLRERLRTLQIGHDETVRRARINAVRQVEVETAKFRAEFAIRVRNASQTLALTQQEIVQRLNLHVQGATQVVGITAKMWQQMIQIGISALGALGAAGSQSLPQPRNTGGGISGNPRAATPTPFHRGGLVTRSGSARLLAGEMVINPAQNGLGGLNINITGQNKRQVLRAVERALDDYNAGRREAAPAGIFS